MNIHRVKTKFKTEWEGLYPVKHIFSDPFSFLCVPYTCVFLAPIRNQNGGDRWNWSGKTLSPGALLAVLYFSSCHIFPPV